MSLIIKGMEMPQSCIYCPCYKEYHKCGAVRGGTIQTSWTKRPDNCPLVEVPTSHGDLIDKSTLLQDLIECDQEIYQNGRIATFDDAFDEVEIALPIINAEEI